MKSWYFIPTFKMAILYTYWISKCNLSCICAFFFFFPGTSGYLYWYIQRRLISHYFVFRHSTFSINNSVLPGSCNRTVFILDFFYGWIRIFWLKLISKFHTVGKQKIRESVIRKKFDIALENQVQQIRYQTN